MYPKIQNLDNVPSSRTADSFLRRIFGGRGSSKGGKSTNDLDELISSLNSDLVNKSLEGLLSSGTTRKSKYKEYDSMDEDTLPGRSLDIYASLVTLGEVDDDESSSTFKIVTTNDSQRKVFEEMENRTNLRKNLFSKVRTLCKYGLNPQELVFEEYKGITKIRHIAPASFKYADESNPGTGDYPFLQCDSMGNAIVKFHPFQVSPFTIGGDESRVYGRSILEPVRKTWKILEVLEMAIVIRELNRSMQKWLWLVDCTGLSKDEARQYAKKLMASYQKLRFVDSAGKFSLTQNLFKDYGDIALPTFDKNPNVDIRPLPVDATTNSSGPGSVLQHYLSKYFGGIGIPNYYFSYEGVRQIRSAAAMNYSDVVLAKTVYRIQTELISYLWDIYRLESEFHGISDYDFKLVLPVVSTVDDLRRFQILNLKIQIANQLRLSLKMVDDQWVFEFLKFSTTTTDRLRVFRDAIRAEEQMMLQAAADGVFLQPTATIGNLDSKSPSPYDLQTAARKERDNPQPPGEEDPFAALSGASAEEKLVMQEKLRSERTFQELLRDAAIRNSVEDVLELGKMVVEKRKNEE